MSKKKKNLAKSESEIISAPATDIIDKKIPLSGLPFENDPRPIERLNQ